MGAEQITSGHDSYTLRYGPIDDGQAVDVRDSVDGHSGYDSGEKHWQR